MNDFIKMFYFLLVAAVVAAVIYMVIYFISKSKRSKPTRSRMLAEYLFIGWCVMFLYITQIMSFGNGMGELINLTPLHPFYIASKYGLINAGLITQILLNVVMTVPLGLLLPIIFPNRFKNYLPILGISFAITLLTEAFQLLTGRSADIDDIIANTLGGLLGFALYVICKGIYYLLQEKKQGKSMDLKHYKVKIIISIFLVVFTFSPFAVIKIMNDSNEVGFVYYGHLQPANIEIADTVSDKETTAKIYKNIQNISLDELKAGLKADTGFTADFVDEDGVIKCKNNEKEAIFIYGYNTWFVTYEYGQDSAVDLTKLPNEKEALALAYGYLEKFHISKDVISYKELADDYGDDNLHLIFESTESTDNLIIWGNIYVTIGENGKLLDIGDNRTHHTLYKDVQTISPKESISIAQDVGVGEWGGGNGSGEGTAYVTAVEPSFYFNKNTGYLIPTWQITASFKTESGSSYDWAPNIDARK